MVKARRGLGLLVVLRLLAQDVSALAVGGAGRPLRVRISVLALCRALLLLLLLLLQDQEKQQQKENRSA